MIGVALEASPSQSLIVYFQSLCFRWLTWALPSELIKSAVLFYVRSELRQLKILDPLIFPLDYKGNAKNLALLCVGHRSEHSRLLAL